MEKINDTVFIKSVNSTTPYTFVAYRIMDIEKKTTNPCYDIYTLKLKKRQLFTIGAEEPKEVKIQNGWCVYSYEYMMEHLNDSLCSIEGERNIIENKSLGFLGAKGRGGTRAERREAEAKKREERFEKARLDEFDEFNARMDRQRIETEKYMSDSRNFGGC